MSNTRGTQYTRDQKLEAATVYVVTGSQTKAGKAIGVGPSTIRYWISTEEPVWVECVDKAQTAWDREEPHKIAGAMQLAMNTLIERLPEATVSQAATTYGILFDKRQIALNRPTSISSKSADIEERLKKNQEMLERLAKPRKIA